MKQLITGASGKLGGYLVEQARQRGHSLEAWSGKTTGAGVTPVDLTDPVLVLERLSRLEPDAVIHSAAMSTVSECFADPEAARRANPLASGLLARWCGQNRVRLVYVSTDMVFDGESAPYSEEAVPTPCTEYGRSKLAAEQVVLENLQAIVVRVALLCGPTKTLRRSFFDGLLEKLHQRKVVHAFADEWRSPLYLGDAADALLDVAATQDTGVLHLAGPERLSRFQMCQRIAVAVGAEGQLIQPSSRLEGGFEEPRQRDLSLDSHRAARLVPNFRPRRIEHAFAER